VRTQPESRHGYTLICLAARIAGIIDITAFEAKKDREKNVKFGHVVSLAFFQPLMAAVFSSTLSTWLRSCLPTLSRVEQEPKCRPELRLPGNLH
jgi:hypothetical protein